MTTQKIPTWTCFKHVVCQNFYKDPMTDGLNNSEEDFCVKGSIYPRYLRRSDHGWLHSLESDPCSVVHSAACSNHR